MNRQIKSVYVLAIASALILSVLGGCSRLSEPKVSPSPSPSVMPASPSPSEVVSPSPTVKGLSSAEIQTSLDESHFNVHDITWSQDNTMVAFIRDEKSGSNIYVWKTAQAEPELVTEAENTTAGFSWSPDSKYFLINVGNMGPGTITSSLIDSESLKALSAEITTVSVSPPVWSPDSRFIALSTSTTDGTIEISIFAVASKTSVSIFKSNNSSGPYIITKWENGTITYTEVPSTGERVENTIAIGD